MHQLLMSSRFFFSEPQQCQTGEEATSVQRAAGRFITLRRCSVTARVSTNAVFSAVSTAGKPTLLELIQRTTSVFFSLHKVKVKYFMSLLALFSTLFNFILTLMQPLFYVIFTSFIHFRHTLSTMLPSAAVQKFSIMEYTSAALTHLLLRACVTSCRHRV